MIQTPVIFEMLFQNLSPSRGAFDRAIFGYRRLPAGRVCRRCAQRAPEPREFPYRARDRAVAVLPDRRAHLVSPHCRCQLPRGAWRRHLPDRGRLRCIRQRHVREPSGLYRHARQSGFAVRRTPRVAARDHHPWRGPAAIGNGSMRRTNSARSCRPPTLSPTVRSVTTGILQTASARPDLLQEPRSALALQESLLLAIDEMFRSSRPPELASQNCEPGAIAASSA